MHVVGVYTRFWMPFFILPFFSPYFYLLSLVVECMSLVLQAGFPFLLFYILFPFFFRPGLYLGYHSGIECANDWERNRGVIIGTNQYKNLYSASFNIGSRA